MDTIDGMRSFVTAVEAGSFTAAADRLGLSKKLVSKYVAELEARLGTRLLHRTTRTLALTEAGSAAYAQCLDILDRVDALKSGSQAGTRDLAGTIRLSAPVTFGEVYLPSLLQSFAARHPRIEFDLRLNDRYVDLTDEGFDLAIRVGRLEASGLIARKLGVTRLLVVASPAYLAAHGAPAVPGDLKDHVCIRDTNLRGGIEWPLTSGEQIRRHRVSGRFRVDNAQVTRDLALAGEGLALCPDFLVEPNLRDGTLVSVMDRHRGPELDIQAVYLASRQLPRKVRVLIEHLARSF